MIDKPRVVWTEYYLVSYSGKGEKKTAALTITQSHWRKLHVDWVTDDNDEKPVHAPQLIVDHFSFEELHSIMCRNQGQILGLLTRWSAFAVNSISTSTPRLLTEKLRWHWTADALGPKISSPTVQQWRRQHLMSLASFNQYSCILCLTLYQMQIGWTTVSCLIFLQRDAFERLGHSNACWYLIAFRLSWQCTKSTRML